MITDHTFERLAAAHDAAERRRDELILQRAPAREIDASWREVGAAARACHDWLAAELLVAACLSQPEEAAA